MSPGSTPCSSGTFEVSAGPCWRTSARSRRLVSRGRSGTTGSASTSREFHAVPGRGARQVRINLDLYANSGANLNEGDPKPRHNTYEYILQYTPAGEVDEYTPGTTDWVSVGADAMFAPLNVMQVVKSRWQGHNPEITETNVRAVDMANGGGSGFAGAPPTFRPVGAYEAGRPSMFAGNTAGGSNGLFGGIFGDGSANPTTMPGAAPSQPRRGGLFRVFGR